MSEFLFIVPTGWIQIPTEFIYQIPGMFAAVDSWITSTQYPTLTQELVAVNAIAVDANVVEAVLFNSEILLVRLG